QGCAEGRALANDKRVLLYYNGHGVPIPSDIGEIWFFNRNYTEYVPVSIWDVSNWLGSPSVMIFDCSAAGRIINRYQTYRQEYVKTQLRDYAQMQMQLQVQSQASESVLLNQPLTQIPEGGVSWNGLQIETAPILFGACDEGEILPMNPEWPRDIFTSCLLTPLKIAVKWFVKTHEWLHISDEVIQLLDNPLVGGDSTDHKSPLGELAWILLTVTDTIAWNVLPTGFFFFFFF
ncbi:regulatory-associated protein of mTOR, partial [Reticulomyxa filosa]